MYPSGWSNPYNPYNLQQTYNTYQTNPFQPPRQQSGPTKLNGPESALEFGRSMPPNSMSEALFDIHGGVFYIVSTDGAGVPSLETFDYSPHVDKAPPAPTSQAVSREEFEALVAKVNDMEAHNGIHGPVQPDGAAS